MPPFQALFGRPPPAAPHYTRGHSSSTTINETLARHQEILAGVKTTLERTRQRMRDQANKHRSEKEFEVGSWVFLKLQIYRQSSVGKRQYQKLSRRYYGPFKITERIGKVAYRLQLPESSKIHPIFHVSLLKEVHGDIASSKTHQPQDFINFVSQESGTDLEDKVLSEGREHDTDDPGTQARPIHTRRLPARYAE